MPKKRKGDTVPGILTVLFGLAFLFMTRTNAHLSFAATTTDGVPGAGFFPYILSVLVIVTGICLFIRGIKQNGTKQYVTVNAEMKRNIKVVVLTTAGLAVFLVFWYITGLFIAGTLLFVIYLNKIYRRTWRFTLLYGVIFTIFVYLVFKMAFSIQFTV